MFFSIRNTSQDIGSEIFFKIAVSRTFTCTIKVFFPEKPLEAKDTMIEIMTDAL